MVPFSSFAKPHIMIGGNCENHFCIYVQLFGKFHALFDYHLDVVTLMSPVKLVVQRNNLLLNVLQKVLI